MPDGSPSRGADISAIGSQDLLRIEALMDKVDRRRRRRAARRAVVVAAATASFIAAVLCLAR